MASQSETKDKLYAAIDEALVKVVEYDAVRRVVMLRELSLAYRYVSGGPQPGSGAGDK